MIKLDTAILLCGKKSKDQSSIDQTQLTENIKCLLENDFKNIIISTNIDIEYFESLIKKNNWDQSIVRVTKERESLGSGGAIKNVLLGLNIEEALVVYKDIDLPQFDLNKMKLEHNLGDEDSSLFTSQNLNSQLQLKNKTLNALDKIFVANISIFNHTHLTKFSFITELLSLSYDDEFNIINL